MKEQIRQKSSSKFSEILQENEALKRENADLKTQLAHYEKRHCKILSENLRSENK